MERTKRLLVDRNIDIALIQEPYALGTGSPEMYGVPAGYTAFHNLTEHHTSGAAVIAKNSLRAKICNYGRNDIAGVNTKCKRVQRRRIHIHFVHKKGQTLFILNAFFSDRFN